MESLRIEQTDSTPYVDFNKRNLILSGESRPEDSKIFYVPLLSWLEEFKHNLESDRTLLINNSESLVCEFEFNLDYFNSTSAKYVVDIANILRSIQDLFKPQTSRFKVKWLYEELDDDIRESGEEIIDWTGLEMELIRK